MVRSLHKNPARHKISLIIILLLMPAIQLGYTYYISWQVLSLILLFQFVGINTFLKRILPGLFLLLLMELSVFLLPINDVLRPFLNVGRQFILFFLLYLLINKIPRMADYYNKWVQRVIIAEVLLITVLVVLQFLGYPSRSMYYIPADYYIAGQNTLPDALDFRYSNVRPVGTFAEPSYLGFFMMSLYVVILTRFRENRLKWFLIGLSFVVILLAQTVAGLAAFFFISINFLATRGGRRITRAVLAANFGLALLFIFLDVFDVFSIYRTGGVSFFSRIVNIFNDNSAYGRLVAPFKLLQDAISINLFGIPLTELRTFFRIDSSTYISGLDNGLMNLFIAFGLTAVIIIFLLVRSLRRDPLLVLYFFLVAMFNGAIFSFDKTVMIGVVIILSGVRLRKAVDHEH